MVRCVKVALNVVLRERRPKAETLLTLLAEVEHTVNSRPLMHVPADPTAPAALSPNEILIGTTSGMPTLTRHNISDLDSRKQWRQSQAIADLFWTRWLREYLPELLPRSKWQHDTEPIRVGDVVIIVNYNFPRNLWLKGLVKETHPGTDGKTRIAKVHTKFGDYLRPVHKLIPLATRN